MSSIRQVRRVVVVVLDGLRPDAITAFGLDHLARLAAAGASTLHGATVSPSVTAACMATLLTGAPPERHGVRSDRFHIPRPSGPVHPVPRVLAEAGLPSSAFMCRVPLLMRGVARRIASSLGVAGACLAGRTAPDVLANAHDTLRTQRHGLILFHWPDGDDAGHAHGWMSRPYEMAARRLDATLGELVHHLDLWTTRGTLLVVLADHGGGGAKHNDHDSDHPLDRTIPIVLAGAGVVPGALAAGAHLLDVPPTILHALGVAVPRSYGGRVLSEAFTPAAVAV